MKREAIVKFTITLLTLASLVYCLMPDTLAQPTPGCAFYGYVTVRGEPAPDGLNVTAAIRGSGLSWTTQTVNGTYGWGTKGSSQLLIPSDNSDSPEKDGGVAGDAIQFYVNGTSVAQAATFEPASVARVDLSIPGNAMEQSILIVALDCPATYTGYNVTIRGRLADSNGYSIPGASLLATYSIAGEQSWHDIASFNTTTNGNYNVEWVPDITGNYSIRVSWEGSENAEGTEASVNLAVTPLEQKYVFSVVSNSTISGLAFNSTSKTLSFTLDGPSGTEGYANVTIAKELIADPNGMKVYLDGYQIDHTTIANDASWLLHFTYQQSTHKAVVDLTLPTQPFFETPLGIATLFGIVVVLIAIIFIGHNRLTRHKKT